MNKKKSPMTPADVDRLASSTEDAYSFDRYANWHACAYLLSRRGYTYRRGRMHPALEMDPLGG